MHFKFKTSFKKNEEEKPENEIRQPNQEESVNIIKPNLCNQILNMKDEIMKLHTSFKEYIQQHYINWWRYLLSLVTENISLNKESFEILYVYICRVLRKGREMLKCNYSKTVGPHISLLLIIKLFNLVDNTESFSFYKKLKSYNRRYSTELNESLNKIKGKLERLAEERHIDIPNTGINEKIDS